MARTTQDELYRKFLDVAGQQAHESADSKAMLADVIAQFQEVRSRVPGTTPTTQSQASKATTDSIGSTAGSLASIILKSGFGLAPLVAGLASLFKGGESETPPALANYAMPGSIAFQATESNSRMTAVDYDQMGLARSYQVQRPAEFQQAAQGWALPFLAQGQPSEQIGAVQFPTQTERGLQSGVVQYPTQNQRAVQSEVAQYPTGSQPASQGGAGQHITVNIQAMDARSFLDRSNDIALAVRDAMLNLNPINDVVNEL